MNQLGGAWHPGKSKVIGWMLRIIYIIVKDQEQED